MDHEVSEGRMDHEVLEERMDQEGLEGRMDHEESEGRIDHENFDQQTIGFYIKRNTRKFMEEIRTDEGIISHWKTFFSVLKSGWEKEKVVIRKGVLSGFSPQIGLIWISGYIFAVTVFFHMIWLLYNRI